MQNDIFEIMLNKVVSVINKIKEFLQPKIDGKVMIERAITNTTLAVE